MEIEKIEVLGNGKAMKEDGVKRYPALVYGEKSVSGFLLTRAAIRNFLTDL